MRRDDCRSWSLLLLTLTSSGVVIVAAAVGMLTMIGGLS